MSGSDANANANARNVRPRLLAGGRPAPPADWREGAPATEQALVVVEAPAPLPPYQPEGWDDVLNAHYHPKFLKPIHDKLRTRDNVPTPVLLEQYPLVDGDDKRSIERRTRQRILAGTINFLMHDYQRIALSDRIFLRANQRVLEKLAAGEFPCYTHPELRKPGECDLRVYVTAEDTLDCAKRLNQQYGLVPMVLNMANETHPGGGYRSGRAAQEENLFRRTDLHFRFTEDQILGGVGRGARYTEEWRCKIAGENTGCDYMPTLYNPCICVRGSEKRTEDGEVGGYEMYPEDEMFPFFELRAAAFDVASLGADKETERMEARRRIRAHLEKADSSHFGHNAVVLSAFGCGAFGGDPQLVAEEYADAILDMAKPRMEGRSNSARALQVINFAIYYAGRGPDNYAVFKRVLGEKLNGPLQLTERGLAI